MENNRKYHSLFWPIILVGAGIVLLLRNLGVIPAFNPGILLRLWPLLLVVLGLDILFGRKAPWAGTLIGLVAAGAVIAFLVFSPSLGINTGQVTKTEVFSAPLEDAKSAKYYFETASDPVYINALSNSSDLIKATITHQGTMNFDVSGTTEKSVRLTKTSTSDSWLTWDLNSMDQKWDIGLSPDIGTEIVLDGGSGLITLDLSGIQLESLKTNLGSGASKIFLPKTTSPYTVEVESGSGSVNLAIAKDADMTLSLDSGSGSVHISVPSGAALRVEVADDGSGSLNIPNGLDKVTDSSAFSSGTWQTTGFEKAASKITIKIVSRGSGSITIN